MNLARPEGQIERLAVHVREHEHRPGGGVLRDRGHETVFVEPDLGGHAASAPGRTRMPRCASRLLRSATTISPEWKIEAARAASAPVRSKSSTKCERFPAPPDAITGTRTAPATRAAR